MTMSNETVHRFAIPSDNMGELNTVFAKLARRAKRLGLPAPTFQEIGTERVVKNQGKDNERTYLLHNIIVDPGTAVVKVNGWTFTATIQHTDDGNILRNISGDDLPLQYRTASDLCEHCNTNRYRKNTYILRNDTTGAYKQVGRNCLSDFFGHDALMYAERAQYLLDLSDQCDSLQDDLGFGGGGGQTTYTRLELYLGHVAECIAREGWLSKSKAREQDREAFATALIADRHMTKTEKYPLYTEVSEESHKLAEDAIEWAENIEGEEVSEYLHNIRLIAKSGVCTYKTFGMAASIVSTYQREVVKAEERKRKAALPPSEYQGTVGEDIQVDILVEKTLTFDGSFGTTVLHIMSDDQGNRYTWFSSGTTLETAKRYTVRGTVKKHEEYKGKNTNFPPQKQTVLTRCGTVDLKTYSVEFEGQVYTDRAATEKEFQGMAKKALGIKRWSKALKVTEVSPKVDEVEMGVPEPRVYDDMRDPMFNTYND